MIDIDDENEFEQMLAKLALIDRAFASDNERVKEMLQELLVLVALSEPKSDERPVQDVLRKMYNEIKQLRKEVNDFYYYYTKVNNNDLAQCQVQFDKLYVTKPHKGN